MYLRFLSFFLFLIFLFGFCCGTTSADKLPHVGFYNPSRVGWIGDNNGDYYSEVAKFYPAEFFGDDIASNLTELQQRYDVIVVIGAENRISVSVEDTFTKFVEMGGGLFVAGPLVGWKYPDGSKRPGNAFCKKALGISQVGETCGIRNITFYDSITNSTYNSVKKMCFSTLTPSIAGTFAWFSGTTTVVGTRNVYGKGHSIYFGAQYIGEGRPEANFTGRDEFILKSINWLANGKNQIPEYTLYPLPDAHDAIVFWTIDDGIFASPYFDFYKNLSRQEIFEWMGFRSALQSESRAENIKDIIDNHNTVMVGLHPTDETVITHNTSKTPEEVQSDTEQYITDCKNAWENLGYDTQISGWRSSGYGFVYDPNGSFYPRGIFDGDEKVPEYPALMNTGISWTSEFYDSNAGFVRAQFPFNIVAHPGYGDYNKSTTFPLLAYFTPTSDGSYAGWTRIDERNDRIVGWADDVLIPALDEAMKRHSIVTVLSHAGVAWDCENGTKEVKKFLDYAKDKDVIFSDHDTFTKFWNAKNNVHITYNESSVTIQTKEAIHGLTISVAEDIPLTNVSNHQIFLKGNKIILDQLSAGENITIVIQNEVENEIKIQESPVKPEATEHSTKPEIIEDHDISKLRANYIYFGLITIIITIVISVIIYWKRR